MYFSGQPVSRWESQAQAVARVEAVVAEHGEAIYVTHGTVLSLFMASRCPELDAYAFWTRLRNPDAWQIEGAEPVRVG